MDEQSSLGLDPGEGAPVLPPLSDEPEYPSILLEMAEMLEVELVKAEVPAPQAAAVAETMTEHLRERYGGQNIYLPKNEAGRAKRRRAAMWADFTGDNYREIARKYGMSQQHAYRCIRMARTEHTKRTQGDLFGAQG